MTTVQPVAPGSSVTRSSGYIVGPLYDSLLFILTPLLFVLVVTFLHYSGMQAWNAGFLGRSDVDVDFLLFSFGYVITMAHLVAVFYRSHLNRSIFPQFKARFTIVPILLFVGLYTLDAFYLVMIVFLRWFDVYHSSLQTFGFGRLYDMRAGNDPDAGRRLDYFLALLTYSGPIFAGVSLFQHIRFFEKFETLGLPALAAVPGWAMENQESITMTVLGGGILFLAYYVYRYWRLYQDGYNVSWQKVTLHVSLLICSVYAWGFNTFGQAFFIMESYHAVQYFALVWWSEKKNMQRVIGCERVSWGRQLAFLFFLVPCLAFGFFAFFSANTRLIFCILMVPEFLHYWYDGFVWSVRKKQIS